jgi:carboxymethylenebutenolidase
MKKLIYQGNLVMKLSGKKYLPVLLVAILVFSISQDSSAQSCCTGKKQCEEKTAESGTDNSEALLAFASLSQKEDFAKAHDAPLPYIGVLAGNNIRFATPDSSVGRGYLIRAQRESNRYLIVLHEWWGLNDHVRGFADRLARDMPDVNVLALDLYDSLVAKTPAEAQQLVATRKGERCKAILSGARTFAGKRARFGTIGFCWGGGWSLQASLEDPTHTLATVIYYGMPERDVARLSTLQGPVLGIFAEQDTYITPEVVEEFRGSMKKAGKTLIVESYAADHAFANPSNPHYNREVAERAYTKTIGFLRGNLK